MERRVERDEEPSTRTLRIIGAPTSAGAYAPGQEKAPAAFRRHGLLTALAATGRKIEDSGDIRHFRWRPDMDRPTAANLGAVIEGAAAVAAHVEAVMASSHDALVLGGDCTVELGTVSGALRGGASVGLVYIDWDFDLNPPEASDGALDWTGVAHLLGLPGTEPSLAGLDRQGPMLGPQDILYFAAENMTPSESDALRDLAIERITSKEVKQDPAAAARRAVGWGSRFDRLLVHLDVDVLDFAAFPIAENVRRCPGLTLPELSDVLAALLRAPNWRALTITEVNPDHAPDEAESFAALNSMLARSLGG
jgi:arginase